MKKAWLVVLLGCAPLVWGCSQQNFQMQDQQQSFSQVQAYNNKVDLLLVMDTSSSMVKYRQRFANQIPQLISKLNASQMDYRIGVTTTDLAIQGSGGKLVGSPKVLTQSTPNLVSTLQDRINFINPGSPDEMGLESVRRLLDKEGSALVRPDGFFVIIFLTDENDYSYDQSGYIPTANYIKYLDSYKPFFPSGLRGWVAHLIGVHNFDEMNNCGTVEVGVRYMDLVQPTGGKAEPICSGKMEVMVENIRVQIVQLLSDYYLNRKPRKETIRVMVRGELVREDPTNGWQYDATLNRVRFNGSSIPGVYDSISVQFTPLDAGS